ncbi:flagellar hook-basal body complex protein FliE [Sphingobium lignivorans]|uniref:Flagellar hook-basal body complex protein FliE n=1 Tax=Sphingobium lignivorans TaxID=2735886 RepID=A0ABR6NCQ3_9SPHN|nr:flagellar hook-basal body complex protein FliE [Sphingobium lignivorans]MBB5984293.1 flagellar hook-basal body complex protein FliE [Sphingobium lignivorans]
MAGLSVDNVLALRQSILQRNNAIRDVASGAAPAAGETAGAPGKASFSDALRSAVHEVSNLQSQSSEAAAAFERGETTDIAAVMLAKQQASVGFETTLQVRNKLLSAYKDIMSMPV